MRLLFIALACLAVTVLLVSLLNSLIDSVAGCYESDTCLQTPILATIAYTLDAVKHVVYFAIFPLGAVFGRRDFRKLFPKSRLPRRVARIGFSLIPLFLLPLTYIFALRLF
ncbi:MAG TPA: hypothetical protein VNA17_12520 [Pyrinomonadaceae bacterium]|nr:hypothetical protein [Pyrinomonadaceae bacterium]